MHRDSRMRVFQVLAEREDSRSFLGALIRYTTDSTSGEGEGNEHGILFDGMRQSLRGKR